jgi:hypothetical protein
MQDARKAPPIMIRNNLQVLAQTQNCLLRKERRWSEKDNLVSMKLADVEDRMDAPEKTEIVHLNRWNGMLGIESIGIMDNEMAPPSKLVPPSSKWVCLEV